MGWPFLSIRQERWRGGYQWGTLFVLNQVGEWDPVCYLYEVPGSDDDLSKFHGGRTRLREGTYQIRIFAGGPGSWGLELYQLDSQESLPIQQVSVAVPADACLMLVDFRDFESGGPRKRNRELCARSCALMERLRFRYSALDVEMRDEPLATVTTSWPMRNPVRAIVG